MRALHAELVKLRTTRLWWGLLLGAVALVVFQVGFTALSAGQSLGPGAPSIPPLTQTGGITVAYGAGYQTAYLMLAVLGAIIGSTDVRHRTATQTFLAAPRRRAVVGAKLATGVVAGLGYAVVTQLVTVLTVLPFALGDGASPRLAQPDVLRSLLLGAPGIALWAAIGVTLGLLLRNQIGAVVLAVGLIFLADPLLGLALDALDADAVPPYLPGNASTAVVEGLATVDLVSWWVGLLVLTGYTVVIAALASLISLRRDVN